MQVFKAFLRVLRSKFGSAIIYIVLFALVGIIMTTSDTSQTVWEKAAMAVVINDLDDSVESRTLAEFISRGNKIVAPFDNEDDLTDAMYYARVDFALTIPEGFGARLSAGETDGLLSTYYIHESYSMENLKMLLDKFVTTFTAYRALGLDSAAAAKATDEALSKEVEVTIASRVEEEKDNEGLLIFFRYLPYILMCVIMNTLCPALTAMNKKDVRFRTDCSGIRPSSYTMQVFSASALFVGLIWLVFVILGVAMNGALYSGRLWLVVLNSLLFALFASVLALFASEFSPSGTIVNILTQVTSLGMCFLCGVFVGQELLGSGVLAAARFLPAYWYIRLIRMLNGEIPYTSSEAALCLCIQAGFIAVFVFLTLLVRRSRYTSVLPHRASAAEG